LVVLLESLRHLSLSASALAALDLREICIFLRSNRLSRLAHGAQMAARAHQYLYLLRSAECMCPARLHHTPLDRNASLTAEEAESYFSLCFRNASKAPPPPDFCCCVFDAQIFAARATKVAAARQLMRLLFAQRAHADFVTAA
jgi:hypothetical protein